MFPDARRIGGARWIASACPRMEGTMKRIMLAAGAVMVMSGAAGAQSFDWSGGFFGGQVGYGFGEKLQTYAGPTEVPHEVSGWYAGAQGGFNYQAGMFVGGVEVDGGWTSIGGEATCFGVVTCETDIDFLSSLTARAGAAFGIAMIYAEGGFALALDTVTQTTADPIYEGSVWNWGWTVGGGVELGIGQGLSVDLEYGYFAFGEDEMTIANTADPDDTIDLMLGQSVHLVRLGVNSAF
jgi:outer membrane immunogenic protein